MAYDFPASPSLGQTFNNYVWDGEKWKLQSPPVTGAVRYDIAQSLSEPQKGQARANIGASAGKKNYIINGAMMISQENGVTVGTTNLYYAADQFSVGINTTGAIGFANVAAVTPAGSPNRIRFATSTLDTSIAAVEVAYIRQAIEGSRVADLRLGTAAAKTFTLQFGVKAPAGTYCVAFLNGAANRSYIAEYVISAGEANTDVVKSITITGDVTGAWSADSNAGLLVNWMLMGGSTYTGTANAWIAGALYVTSSQFNFLSQNAANFELFDVSLTEGSVAPPFGVTDYASELALCRRYWERTGMVTTSSIATNFPTGFWTVEKRAVPTLTFSVDTGTGATYAVTNSALGKSFYQNAAHSSIATATITGNARL